MSLDKATISEELERFHDRERRAGQKPHEIYKQEMAYLARVLEENEDLLYGLFWDEYNKYLDVPESQRRFIKARFMDLFDGIMQKSTNRAVRFAGGLLLDPRYPVRDFVAEALGRMGSLDAYNYLMAVVYDDPQFASRAVYALGQIGAIQAEPLLVNMVNGNIESLDDLVQAYALDALYLLGTSTAWEVIASVAAGPNFDELTRREAIRFLYLKKDKEFIPLLQHLTNDENQMVRENATIYLRELEKSS